MRRSLGMAVAGACVLALGCGPGHDRQGSSAQSLTHSEEPTTARLIGEYPDFGTGIVYASGHIYASSVYDNLVRVYDPTTHGASGTIPVGRGPIRLITDGTTVYSVNQWAQDPGDAYVSAIDAARRTVTGSLGVSQKRQGSDPNNYPTTGFPQDAALLDGQLFVSFPTNPQPDIISVDTGSMAEGNLFAAGHGPWRLTAVAGTLVVINERVLGGTDDAILEMTPTGELLATHETPGTLSQAIAAAGKAWVSRTPVGGSAGLVMVIDPTTHAMRSVTVGKGPDGLTEHDGKIYVVCTEDKRIDIIDASSETVVGSISLAKVAPEIPRPRSLAVTPSGELYIRSIDGSAGGLPKGTIFALDAGSSR